MSKKRSLWTAVKYAYWHVVPYNWRPSQMWYRLKCFCWHRYTTIHPTTLPWHTWTDRSELLPHMMFQILTSFVDEECSPGWVDWEGSGHTIVVDGVEKNVRQEMQDLYDWWKRSQKGEYTDIYDADLHKEYEENWAKIEKLGVHGFEGNKFASKFDSEEDAALHSSLMRRNIDISNEDSALLIKNMQRLCACQPYMWT